MYQGGSLPAFLTSNLLGNYLHDCSRQLVPYVVSTASSRRRLDHMFLTWSTSFIRERVPPTSLSVYLVLPGTRTSLHPCSRAAA
jgi:hypothetical protein